MEHLVCCRLQEVLFGLQQGLVMGVFQPGKHTASDHVGGEQFSCVLLELGTYGLRFHHRTSSSVLLHQGCLVIGCLLFLYHEIVKACMALSFCYGRFTLNPKPLSSGLTCTQKDIHAARGPGPEEAEARTASEAPEAVRPVGLRLNLALTQESPYRREFPRIRRTLF